MEVGYSQPGNELWCSAVFPRTLISFLSTEWSELVALPHFLLCSSAMPGWLGLPLVFHKYSSDTRCPLFKIQSIRTLVYFLLNKKSEVCVWVHMCACPHMEVRGQLLRVNFSFSMWVLRTACRLSGLLGCTFTCWAILHARMLILSLDYL